MKININGNELNENTKINYKTNPKRPGFKSHERYEIYQVAKTIGEYLELNEKKYQNPDLRYDMDKGYLIIEDNNSIFDTIDKVSND